MLKTRVAKSEDLNPQETREWLEALDQVIEDGGPERARYLLERLAIAATKQGAPAVLGMNTPYVNTIPVEEQIAYPGDRELERRIKSLVRWNAVAMVVRANKYDDGIGGHISTFASSATLIEVGMNHFFRARIGDQPGDLVYFQGHSSPGMYARAFLEGRISEEQMYKFRQEVDGGGLSSYPHPWLMPNFWQFPTVSMGLGPLMAIYQARFMRYLQHRDIVNTDGRKVWAFLGDGEMDEPESLGAISMAGREKLDNLIFVVNCNLQRLDGPVRGNGKIIQELEGVFRGAGWNVIKLVWGGNWDRLLAKDKSGLLLKRMDEVVDGEYQTYKAKNGAYVRQHFFGKYPELLDLVADMSDDEIWRLNRGGHDPYKVYAAYAAAVKHNGQPTVILAKTVKGYGMGASGEAQNPTHQQKKMDVESLRSFRDRFNIPVTDEQLPQLPFCRPAEDSQEMKYLRERMAAMGTVPVRKPVAQPLQIPGLDAFEVLLKGTEEREISTTMAFVRMLGILVKDKNIGKQIVPIVPDESRTFGMEGMFRQLGIFSQVGQLYTPEDADQLMFYKESSTGQILQEGINEAGGMADWMAAATSYANHGTAMIPFFIYYSMFGFQRVGDLAWAAGDMRSRGFLMGGTAGRTTLNGEGLQHQDGHSQSARASRAPARVQLWGSAAMLNEALRAQRLLWERYQIPADVWNVTSYNELRREALSVERWNRLHPAEAARKPYIQQVMEGTQGPITAASDYMKVLADQLSPWLSGRLVALGTDGYGRSDSRPYLRRFFEVDAESIAASALAQLARWGQFDAQKAHQALYDLGIDPDKKEAAKN
jgi:pyruvate dehydrogenase E1 component